jgi:hypothetical protein
MDKKKVALVVVVCLVIVVCAVFIVRTIRGGSVPPTSALNQKMTVICASAPFTMREITIGEKLKLSVDDASGYWKMEGKLWARPHQCATCNEWMPEYILKPGTPMPGKVMAEQKCPKCGKQAYAPQ